MTASSTTSPWSSGTTAFEVEIGETFREYQQALALIAETQGIPGLMAELSRINAARQQQAVQTLAEAVTSRLEATVGRLDSISPRSRPTGSPSPGSERGRAREDSPRSRQPEPWSPRSRWAGLGPDAARRIAAAQRRADEARGR